jgi:2-oxoglutarate/2-oxoacid ferredoxin oxidoreductase subunit beta
MPAKNKDQSYKSPHKPTWCPGCGNFAIWIAIQNALKKLNIPPHKVLIAYGVGCSGNMANTLNTYGWHSLHGRALPTGVGAKLANNDLTVIVAGGDGDGYGEGLSHFIHSIRGNADITYIVHDNRIYGLTTGQASPTSARGTKSKSTPLGLIEQPLNPMALSLSAGIEFVARGFSGKPAHLTEMVVNAIQHRGFSLLDVFQPCVTFNKVDTYDFYNKVVYDLQEDQTYNVANFDQALEKSFETTKLPIGVFYQNPSRPSYENALPYLKGKSLVSIPARKRDITKLYKDFI